MLAKPCTCALSHPLQRRINLRCPRRSYPPCKQPASQRSYRAAAAAGSYTRGQIQVQCLRHALLSYLELLVCCCWARLPRSPALLLLQHRGGMLWELLLLLRMPNLMDSGSRRPVPKRDSSSSSCRSRSCSPIIFHFQGHSDARV